MKKQYRKWTTNNCDYCLDERSLDVILLTTHTQVGQ